MLSLALIEAHRDGGRVLCLGAHCDDIDIGCGATVLTLIEACPQLHVDWLVMSGSGDRAREARTSAERFLSRATSSDIHVASFRDGFFPGERVAIKEYFETLKTRPDPDVILTHSRDDAHQDHRLISELTRNTFRNHLILEYEIPKYDGDFGRPNAFVPITDDVASRKIDILIDSFASQRGRDWFDPRTFAGLMRLRGMECRAKSGMAEAFYCHKIRLGPA